jgi:hypothetical protein
MSKLMSIGIQTKLISVETLLEVAGLLSRLELHQLLANLRVVVALALKVGSSENAFVVQAALSILGSVASLDWLANIDVSSVLLHVYRFSSV